MSLMLYAAMGAATVPPASDPAFDPSAFVFTIRVENDGDWFTWPHRTGGVYDATFDWGDGSSDHVTAEPGAHVYASAGDYDVTVTGTCPAPIFGDAILQRMRSMLTDVVQWGSLAGATRWDRAFADCENISAFSAADSFGSGVTIMSAMFDGATNFNSDISGWDVSSVIHMNDMFRNANSFDQDLSGWCVLNVQPGLPLPGSSDWFADGSALQPAHYPVWGTCP